MKYILGLVVFLCGASLMILELVGSRVLAPYVGSSTIVWTSLIGIILAFLSLGYFWGGKIADKEATYTKLALIIFLSAFFVFLITIINRPILSFVRFNINNVYVGAIIATVILFSIPSFLLGVVSPYAITLKLEDLNRVGRTAGNLYALSTIGSIIGTFSAGFWLIPFFGTIKVLFFVSAVLILAAILAFSKELNKKEVLGLILIIVLITPFFYVSSLREVDSRIVDIDTEYNRIHVFKARLANNPRPALILTTDPFSIQSGMYLDKDDELLFEYLKYYKLSDYFVPNLKSVLLLGGAAYAYPKDFLKNHENATIDVVEIDRGMTDIARKYFNLEDNQRLNIYHQDGRVFLNNNQKKYDVILLDAFTSRLSVPYQLTTIETARKVHENLNNDGVVIFNIVSSFIGEKSKFLQAEYITYKEIFPQVYLFKIDNTDPEEIQNVILIAFKTDKIPVFESEDDEIDKRLKKIWKDEIKAEVPILTDDHAPVDYYIMGLI